MKFSLKNPKDFLFVLGSLGICVGVALALVSWLRLCSEQCEATHFYRLCGLQFEIIGMIFFPLLLIAHFLSRKSPFFAFISSLMIAGAFGSEVMFILVQKYMIGHWCPVCLSIATCVGVAALAYVLSYLIDLRTIVQEGQKGEIMRSLWKGFYTVCVVLIGFFIAFFGIGKVNQLQAQESVVKDQVIFGDLSSPIDVYLFTDWACPACRQLEPAIVKMLPAITKHARFTFVDFIIHPETLNYIPYNLSFMINDKEHYTELRDALTRLSIKTKAPCDSDVEKAIESTGITYQPLSYSDVAVGIKYFKHLGKEFDIDSTPTLVIVNKSKKKGKKLYGGKEITEENVLKAIESLK